MTGNTELDKKLASSYTGALTAKANNIVQLYQDGKLTANDG